MGLCFHYTSIYYISCGMCVELTLIYSATRPTANPSAQIKITATVRHNVYRDDYHIAAIINPLSLFVATDTAN